MAHAVGLLGDEDLATAGSGVELIVRAMREHLAMEVAFVSEFCDGARVFRVVDAAHPPTSPIAAGDSGPLEESYCARVVDGRLPEVIPDAFDVDEAMALPVTAELPVRAHISVPVRLSDGSVYGTFCCFSREPDPSLRDRDADFMRVLATIMAGHFERRRELERQRAVLERRIDRLMGNGGVRMVFQPIVRLDTGEPLGFEALSRFPGSQEPASWFSDAARVGLGVQLELVAARRALARFAELPDGAFMSINLSPGAVGSAELRGALDRCPADRVVIELTEHAVVDDYTTLERDVDDLRAAGVRLAVDDAGAGYASLRHILNIDPEIIKLDISITRGIDHDGARQAMTAALSTFAASTGATLVAEGVETPAERAALESFLVPCAQGYLLGRPSPRCWKS